MRAALHGSGVALRPHFKAQKSSACAKWLQKQAGSELAGLCAQTLTEAEVLLRSGATPSCLLTNEVIGPASTARAAALAVDYPGVLSVLADCEAGVAGLSAAAVSAGAAELAVLVEVDCGQDRCGVDSSRAGAVAALAQAIVDAAGRRREGRSSPGRGATHQRLREAAETGQIASRRAARRSVGARADGGPHRTR